MAGIIGLARKDYNMFWATQIRLSGVARKFQV